MTKPRHKSSRGVTGDRNESIAYGDYDEIIAEDMREPNELVEREENIRLLSLLSSRKLAELFQHTKETLFCVREELEQVKAERDEAAAHAIGWKAECESLRTELSAKDKALEWYADEKLNQESAEYARSILFQYPPKER